jgi:uncharacterized protein (TIGR03792 family)
MVIEWLKVRVAPELREKYIQIDERVWTGFLSRYTGFLGKQVWLNPNAPDELVLVISWSSREAWKAIPAGELEKIEQTFDQAMGEGTYEMLEESEYQIRKFAQAPAHP